MAANKRTHSPQAHTSRRREVITFPQAKGKIVEKVELFSDHEYYAITVQFRDKTALHFPMKTAVFAFPVLSDWKSGNEKILKKYKSVRSNIQRL